MSILSEDAEKKKSSVLHLALSEKMVRGRSINIFVYAEAMFRNTLWFSLTYQGITEEAEKKRYPVTLLDAIPEDPRDLISLFGVCKPILIVMGVSLAATRDTLNQLWEIGIHTILVNVQEEVPSKHCSVLIMDYADAVRQGINRLEARGAERIALFGGYTDSGPDSIKLRSFLDYQRGRGIAEPERDVYLVKDGLAECCDRFMAVCDQYDSLLCCNDIATIAITRRLREIGMTKHDRIAGFVDPMLSDFSMLLPDIISLSATHSEFGRQAVLLYAWLNKNPMNVSATISIPVHQTQPLSALHSCGECDIPMGDLLDDPLAKEILNVERCVSSCDGVDYQILRRLIAGKTRAEIADEVFVSERTIQYRLRRLCNMMQISEPTQLIQALSPWLYRISEKNS